jgi:hypothetical protein
VGGLNWDCILCRTVDPDFPDHLPSRKRLYELEFVREFSGHRPCVGQRGKELAAYYHRVLEPAGEVPLYAYGNGSNDPELEARHVDWLGRDPKRDEIWLRTPVFSGTVMIKTSFLAKQPFWDSPSLRDTIPNARFGNLLIFRGTCACGSLLAPGFYF